MYYTQRSFNGGVISPWVDARSDLQRYRSSLRKCENFICTPYGGLRRRMGSEYVSQTTSRGRLIGYQRSSTEGYVLEFGSYYLRVYHNGTPIAGVYISTPWSSSEVFELQYVKLNNVLFIVHRNHAPQQLRFISRGSWSLSAMDFDHPAFRDYALDGSKVAVVADSTGTSTASIGFSRSATSSQSNSGTVPVNGSWTVSISELSFTDTASTSYVTLQNSTDNGITWHDIQSFSSAGTYTDTVISGILRISALEANVDASLTSSNDVSALSEGDTVTVKSTSPIFKPGHVGSEILISHTPDITDLRLALDRDSVSDWIVVHGKWSLFTSGNWGGRLVVEASYDNGASFEKIMTRESAKDRNIATEGEVDRKALLRLRYAVLLAGIDNNPYATLETDGEDIKGRVLITGYTSESLVTGTVIAGVYSSAQTEFWKESAWSNAVGFPAAITWHEGRIWFGGSRLDPSTLWASASDDFFNFEYGTDDDDAFTRTMGTTELTDILWLASQGSLFIGTSGEEWRGKSYSDSGVITPSSLVLRRVSNSGSEPIAPVFAGAHLMHVQRKGRSIIQIGYNAASSTEDGFAPGDLNQLAPHVTLGGIQTIAYQAIRDGLVWATTGEGKLIGLTFDKAQNISGWHEHTTDGKFESVATVYESGDEDSIYVSVLRNGTRMIERMKVDQYDLIENQGQEKSLYLDSAVVYSGSETSTIGGISHLNGSTVQVVNNGLYEGEKIVANGQVTLDNAGTNVSVGLPYASVLETLPMTFGAEDGSTDSRKKRVSDVSLRVYRSVTAETAMNISGTHRWTKMREAWRKMIDPDAVESEGIIGSLEDWKMPLTSSHDTDARIAVRISEPLPLNILSLTTHFSFSG